jgi:hypothetical protein
MSKPFVRAPKTASLQNAAKAYVSSCCSVLAEKPSAKDNEGQLGKWRCGQCHKRCSVRPTDKTPFTSKKIEPVQGEQAL